MTLPDLLKACASGKMPMVRTSRHVKYALSDVGQVVVIKQYEHGFSGCSVQYPGLNYDVQYWEGDDLGDRCTINELEII